jgi:hypothetical protein
LDLQISKVSSRLDTNRLDHELQSLEEYFSFLDIQNSNGTESSLTSSIRNL